MMSVNLATFTRTPLARTVLLTAAALALVACGSARRGIPVEGPMPLTTASLERGKTLYDMHCYKCHSAGEGGMAPAINNKPLPKSLIELQIRHGLGVMPGFSEKQLSDRDVEDIANYLVALRRHGS
jgi:mono/diheme cytochrome c family protein